MNDVLYSLAESFASWVAGMSAFWDFLNQPISDVILEYQNSGLPDIAKELVAEFYSAIIVFIGAEDSSVLGFILYMIGPGFILYFLVKIVRWILDILP